MKATEKLPPQLADNDAFSRHIHVVGLGWVGLGWVGLGQGTTSRCEQTNKHPAPVAPVFRAEAVTHSVQTHIGPSATRSATSHPLSLRSRVCSNRSPSPQNFLSAVILSKKLDGSELRKEAVNQPLRRFKDYIGTRVPREEGRKP